MCFLLSCFHKQAVSMHLEFCRFLFTLGSFSLNRAGPTWLQILTPGCEMKPEHFLFIGFGREAFEIFWSIFIGFVEMIFICVVLCSFQLQQSQNTIHPDINVLRHWLQNCLVPLQELKLIGKEEQTCHVQCSPLIYSDA